MNRTVKSVIALVLSAIMLCASAVPSFATDRAEWDSVMATADAKAGIVMFPGSDESERNFSWYTDGENTPSVLVSKNADMSAAAEFTGYAVKATEGDFANKVTVTDLAYETGYFVSVKSGIESAITGVLPMESFYTYAFTTKAWSPYIYEDEFEGFEIGQKWEGPQTVKLGNASVTLEAGDSIEYALDEATGKVGFKLVKGTATGNLQGKYT